MDLQSGSDAENGEHGYSAAQISYFIEVVIYAIAMIAGFCAVIYTARRFRNQYSRQMILAARLKVFKINLTIADLIVLFVYAPTQIAWIYTYNWYGGNILCRSTKVINTFSLHLTANMQVLIAADRLYITAHLRDFKQKTGFASNKIIFGAWMLAVACALPQFFVFRVFTLPDGAPQCVSIWTLMRFYEYVQHDAIVVNVNATEPTNSSPSQETIFQFFSEYGTILNFLEHVYNLVHILSIYLLPYLIEMFCYGSILILMKRVNKEKNVGNSHGCKKVQLFDCFCLSTTKSPSARCSEDDPTEMSNIMPAPSSVEVITAEPKSVPTIRQTKSLCNGFYTPISVNFENGSLIITKPKEKKPAWKSTVAVARRKTRKKAFLMLTCNLIFWAPYSIIGILSSIIAFDHSSYDFLNALVVLNAVSNLLL